MAGQVVQMDYEVITAVSKGFAAAKLVVIAVSVVVIAQLEVYKAAAFMAPALVAKFTLWQQNIRDKTKKLADMLQEFSDDLAKAVDDHKRGDVAGKQYFMKGIRL